MVQSKSGLYLYYNSNVKIDGDLLVSGSIISGWDSSADTTLDSFTSGSGGGGGWWSKIDDDTNNIYYSSNVKIGGYSNISPNAELEVNGDIITTGTVTSGYSDDRLKNYTSNIENPIDIIKSLNGYYFKPNALANNFGYYNKDREIGISAQEVQSVLPEIVKLAPFDSARNINNELISKSGSNYLTVDYEKLAPLFIEAIKELTNKINKMDKEFKEYILKKEST